MTKIFILILSFGFLKIHSQEHLKKYIQIDSDGGQNFITFLNDSIVERKAEKSFISGCSMSKGGGKIVNFPSNDIEYGKLKYRKKKQFIRIYDSSDSKFEEYEIGNGFLINREAKKLYFRYDKYISDYFPNLFIIDGKEYELFALNKSGDSILNKKLAKILRKIDPNDYEMTEKRGYEVCLKYGPQYTMGVIVYNKK